MKQYRQRHGRGIRGSLLPENTPRFQTRRDRFDRAVLEAYTPLQHRFAQQLQTLDIAIDTVPRMRIRPEAALASDEIASDGPVPLGRLIPAGVDRSGRPTRARIVLFRMPIMHRCINNHEQHVLLERVLTYLVASYLNLLPTDIEPNFRWPWEE